MCGELIGQERVEAPLPYSSVKIFTLSQIESEVLEADTALKCGLSSIASLYYRDLLKIELPADVRNGVLVNLATALINQQAFDEADALINPLLKKSPSAALQLRAAMVSFYRGNRIRTASILNTLDKNLLSKNDLPWFFLMSGLISGSKEKANSFFEKAKALSVDEEQRTRFASVIAIEGLFLDNPDPTLIASLKEQVKRYKGLDSGFQFSKQYAIALDKVGRKDEAIKVIDEQAALPSNKESLDQLLFLKGYLLGAKSAQAQVAFKEVIMHKKYQNLMELSLAQLLNAPFDQATELLDFFDSLIKQPSPHPLLPEILLASAQLLTLKKQFELAEKDLQRLTQDYPNFSQKNTAYRLLAFILSHKAPPEYRTAAEYISRILEDKSIPPEEKRQLSLLMANCYFLNEDFKTAETLYQSTLSKTKSAEEKTAISYQLILCKVRLNDIGRAAQLLDEMWKKNPICEEYGWQAEWEISLKLRMQNQFEKALERLNSLPEAHMPLSLKVRFLWLKARLNFDDTKYEEALSSAETGLSLCNKQDIHPEAQYEQIASHLLLIKAQALLSLKKIEQGTSVFHELRENFKNSPAAILSYIDEARHLSQQNRRVEAQQMLVSLADNYPKSEQAPIALYEAAINAEMRGPDNANNAISLLERLIKNYPESPLVYFSKMKQAEILKNANDPVPAQQIYENLLNNLCLTPENRAFIELSNARCILAQTQIDSLKQEKAYVVLEKVFEAGSLDPALRIEAGFLWAYNLSLNKQTTQSTKIYWQIISRFLITSQEKITDGNTLFWISKTIFELGSLLEKSNQNKNAQEAYSLILRYNLPGKELAQSKIKAQISF